MKSFTTRAKASFSAGAGPLGIGARAVWWKAFWLEPEPPRAKFLLEPGLPEHVFKLEPVPPSENLFKKRQSRQVKSFMIRAKASQSKVFLLEQGRPEQDFLLETI